MQAKHILLIPVLATACATNPDAAQERSPSHIGVAACDRYVELHTACLEDKVASDERSALTERLITQSETWQRMAQDPATRPGLSETCQFALDKAKTGLKQYGCEW